MLMEYGHLAKHKRFHKKGIEVEHSGISDADVAAHVAINTRKNQ